jgi:hypothetical protein
VAQADQLAPFAAHHNPSAPVFAHTNAKGRSRTVEMFSDGKRLHNEVSEAHEKVSFCLSNLVCCDVVPRISICKLGLQIKANLHVSGLLCGGMFTCLRVVDNRDLEKKSQQP